MRKCPGRLDSRAASDSELAPDELALHRAAANGDEVRDVVDREDAGVAYLPGDGIAPLLCDEVLLEPFGRNLARDRGRITSDARDRERGLVDVRREDLDARQDAGRFREAPGVVRELDGDRIGFLPGGAARHPDPHRLVPRELETLYAAIASRISRMAG
jgi:hypothetical protein